MFRPVVLRLLGNRIGRNCICHPSPVCGSTKLFIGQNLTKQHNSIRYYAKGKNKIKEDKGKGKTKNIEINESLLGEVINFEKFKSELENAIAKLKEVFITQLSLRSSTGAIDNLVVKLENKKYALMELGHVIRKNPKTVIVNMSQFPQAIPAVLKAIAGSGMNLNPQQDGTTLFIPVPKVTKEYREGLAKNAKAQFIKSRDAIHIIQNKYLKAVKNKMKEGLSEDTVHQLSDQIKYLGDMYVTKAEKMLELKKAELLGET
ncbi:ribosome-recycling factor, mitochondrial [Halyomorpha halys]|uniref:ribosome-recycling factor, mitochondrial n=1 Tax=Halyomorpha halys TaxID=286706 RepID=UPI0006D4DF42|nr:ribosome-recycling factor, mitochondrial [Halyomorpha halys]XP_024214221.1 ribosome-recycling factor, mitochondrial [Halyomorpha halys]XP_024214222.1 ribosome-recycling factor, mitochondrial [Halyomorpha halys]